MKFHSILALFALLQVSEASDISCIRSSNGVECFDQISLLNVINEKTNLLKYTYDQQVAKINEMDEWFT